MGFTLGFKTRSFQLFDLRAKCGYSLGGLHYLTPQGAALDFELLFAVQGTLQLGGVYVSLLANPLARGQADQIGAPPHIKSIKRSFGRRTKPVLNLRVAVFQQNSQPGGVKKFEGSVFSLEFLPELASTKARVVFTAALNANVMNQKDAVRAKLGEPFGEHAGCGFIGAQTIHVQQVDAFVGEFLGSGGEVGAQHVGESGIGG